MRIHSHSPPPALSQIRARFLLLVVDPHQARSTLAKELDRHEVDAVTVAGDHSVLWQAAALLPDAVLTTSLPPAISALAHALRARHGIPTLATHTHTDGCGARGVAGCLPVGWAVDDLLPLLHTISPQPRNPGHIALEAGILRLYPATGQVRLAGQRVDLPAREFELLHLLMLHTGRVVTPTQFQQLRWTRTGIDEILRGHVSLLRARLGERVVVEVPPLGYRLDPPGA